MDELLLPGLYRQQVQELQAKLEELAEKKISIHTQGITGTAGKGSGRTEAYFEAHVFRYEKVHSQLVQATGRYIEARLSLCRKIERLENERHKDILYHRYVKGDTVKSIMQYYGYNSIRQVFRTLQHAREEFERMYNYGKEGST